MGRVLLVRLPGSLRPHFAEIGEAWVRELGVETVLTQVAPVEGELRQPSVERIAGETTETEVLEFGIRYQFDAAKIMFATGNRTERRRAGRLTQPGERVADLFAGIGYFAIPAAVEGRARQVVAIEKNPASFDYLRRNVALNRVTDRVVPVLGDNRSVELERGSFDRVFLGYLPSSVDWIPRALALLVPGGGSLHVHLVADVRSGITGAERNVIDAAIAAGGEVRAAQGREVKPYGPGRFHAVVDLSVVPTTSGPG